MHRCSLAASNFVFPALVCTVSRCTSRRIWPFFWPSVSWSCWDLFLRHSALNPDISFSWSFVEKRDTCHTNPWFRQWRVSIHVPIIIDGRLLKYIKACSFFCLWTWINSEVSEISPADMDVRPWSCMIPIYIYNLPYYFRNLVKLQDLDLDLWHPFFPSEDLCRESRLRSPPALYTPVDNGCPSCNISPVMHGNTNSLSLENVHLHQK